MSSMYQKGKEQILPYKGSLQNKKNSKKSDIVTIRSGTYLPYVNSDIKIRGDFKKKTAYFLTSGKKVGGPQTKTKFQKKNEIHIGHS